MFAASKHMDIYLSLLLPLLLTLVSIKRKPTEEGEKRDKIDAFPLTAYLLSDEVKGMKAAKRQTNHH